LPLALPGAYLVREPRVCQSILSGGHRTGDGGDYMTLRVIGAGFGRTGTDSMREALGILGFGPCHHMFEVTENPVMKSRWRAFIAGQDADWEALFEGYASCVDWPAVLFWRELVEAFPEAKVVLTWRSPESWWASYENTLLRYYQTTDDRASVGYLAIDRAFGPRAEDRDHVLAIYEANTAAALAEVPPDRLILHRLGDGWEPLCAGLGVPVPDVPYPNRNSTAEIRQRFSPE